MEKCIIVEGRSDKLKIAPLFNEQVVILCTNGTISEDDLVDLLEPYEHYEMITMFDADRNGEKLRKLMKRVYSEAQHLIIPIQFREVAETPTKVLIKLLKEAKFLVKEG
jgi:toprim domain protein